MLKRGGGARVVYRQADLEVLLKMPFGDNPGAERAAVSARYMLPWTSY